MKLKEETKSIDKKNHLCRDVIPGPPDGVSVLYANPKQAQRGQTAELIHSVDECSGGADVAWAGTDPEQGGRGREKGYNVSPRRFLHKQSFHSKCQF